MSPRWIVTVGLIATCSAASSAIAQVRSETADLNRSAPPAGSFWTEQDEKAMSEILSGAYKVAEPVGSFSSHGGPDEALGQLAKYYENLSKGLDLQGKPIGGSVWRGWFTGRDKASQLAEFQKTCANIASELDKLGKAITIVDSGAKVAGHLYEKDYGGALLTANDELAKCLAMLLAVSGGSTLGPWGAIGAGAATEEAWAETGHKYFEWEKQRLKNLEKIFAHAGRKIRDPDIQAYMRGDLSTDELKRKVLEKREKAKEKWRELAEVYPEIKEDVEALLTLNATSKQRARLLYVSRLDKAATNNPAMRTALKAWLAGDMTREQLNMLRVALGLPPLVPLDPAEIVGRWTNGQFVITAAPVVALIRASAGAAPGAAKTEGLEGCDTVSPEVMQGIAAGIDKQLNQPLGLTVTIAGSGTQGTITMAVAPPAGVDPSQNKPIAVNYQFRPNTLQAAGPVHEGQGYLSLEGKVTPMREGLSIKGTWELRGAKRGGKPDPQAAVMLRGTWSGKKPYSKPPGTAPAPAPVPR